MAAGLIGDDRNVDTAADPARLLDHLGGQRLFDEFDGGRWRSPFGRSFFEPVWHREIGSVTPPAVDVAETEKTYEITAELPGLDEKNIDVKVADGILTIKGEKQEEKEEKKKDYHLSERSYGMFQRSFRVPENVDPRKDRGELQEGRACGDLAEKGRCPNIRQKDPCQGCVTMRWGFIETGLRLATQSGSGGITETRCPRAAVYRVE